MRLPDTFRSVRRLCQLHLRVLSAFAVLGLLAMALSRLEVLVPDRLLWSGPALGQLRGLAQILLFFFVVLPAVPAVWGLSLFNTGNDRVPFPPLAAATCLFWILGGLCLFWATLWGKISPVWLAELGSSFTRGNVSVPQILAILFACGANVFLSLHLLLAARQVPRHELDFARCALLAGAALTFLALPIPATIAFAGLLERLIGIPLLGVNADGAAGFTLWLGMLAASPLQMAVFLSVLGLCANRVGDPGTLAPLRIWIFRLALLSLFALQVRGVPSQMPAMMALSASACQCLLTAGLSMLVARVGLAWLRRGADWRGGRSPALAALACLFWFLPIDLWTHLATASEAFAASHLLLAHHLLLGAGVLLAVAGMTADPGRTTAILSGLTLVAVAATLIPLLRLAATAIPASLPIYPREYLVPHVATALGGAAFLLLAWVHLGLALRRSRAY